MRKWIWGLMALALLLGLAGCDQNDPVVWRTVTYDGLPAMVEKVGEMPATDISGATVVAVGTAADAAFVDAVETATHKTEPQALALLQSFDTTHGHQAAVLTLTHDTAATRYWSDPAGKVGRWYTRCWSDHLFTPTEAIRSLALPLSNDGRFATQYRLHDGAVVVHGLCADMTGDPATFGPTATGGGEQFFAPDATQYNAETHVTTLNPAVATPIEEVRYLKP